MDLREGDRDRVYILTLEPCVSICSMSLSVQEMPSNKWRWGDAQGLPDFAEQVRTWTPGQAW